MELRAQDTITGQSEKLMAIHDELAEVKAEHGPGSVPEKAKPSPTYCIAPAVVRMIKPLSIRLMNVMRTKDP